MTRMAFQGRLDGAGVARDGSTAAAMGAGRLAVPARGRAGWRWPPPVGRSVVVVAGAPVAAFGNGVTCGDGACTSCGERGWEGVAVAVEDGLRFYAGAVPTDGSVTRGMEVADLVATAWQRVGMPLSSLSDVVVTPACGLAGARVT